MILKYDVEISNEVIIKNMDRITNRIFKLLPNREEGGDWTSALENLIIEVVGMNRLFIDQIDFLPLLCKMEALLTLTEEKDFLTFRKIIFECLGLMNELKKCLV